MDSFIKRVTFKDDTGKPQSYIATFVKVDGGYKISDEDMQQINEAMHKGATWEDTSKSSDRKLEEETNVEETSADDNDPMPKTELSSYIHLNDDALENEADDVKDAERHKAHLKTLADRTSAGEDEDTVIDDILASNVRTPEGLYKSIHDELYTDEEKTALGKIANAIRDRWQ